MRLYKIKNTNPIAIQQYLFSKGYSWGSRKRQVAQHIKAYGYTVYSDLSLRASLTSQTFESFDCPEYSLEMLINNTLSKRWNI